MKRLALAAALLMLALPAKAAALLSITITAAVTAQVTPTLELQSKPPLPTNVTLQCNFTYGSGGTSADAWVQTSVDGGNTWIDVYNCHVTTSSLKNVVNLSSLTPLTTAYVPTDGSLAANTAKDGIISTLWRVKYTTVGTYGGNTTLRVDMGMGLAIQ